MLINPMNEHECAELLSRVSFGRLGCALDNQAYVVPIYFAHDGKAIYVLSTLGQKIEWMRENPRVCLQVDEIKGQSQWVSVIVNGEYQELPEPEFTDERNHARQLLEKKHNWWMNSMAERMMKSADPLIDPLFFRIRIDSVTGLRAEPK